MLRSVHLEVVQTRAGFLLAPILTKRSSKHVTVPGKRSTMLPSANTKFPIYQMMRGVPSLGDGRWKNTSVHNWPLAYWSLAAVISRTASGKTKKNEVEGDRQTAIKHHESWRFLNNFESQCPKIGKAITCHDCKRFHVFFVSSLPSFVYWTHTNTHTCSSSLCYNHHCAQATAWRALLAQWLSSNMYSFLVCQIDTCQSSGQFYFIHPSFTKFYKRTCQHFSFHSLTVFNPHVQQMSWNSVVSQVELKRVAFSQGEASAKFLLYLLWSPVSTFS